MRSSANKPYRNGTLVGYFATGTSEQDFKRRLKLVLEPPPAQDPTALSDTPEPLSNAAQVQDPHLSPAAPPATALPSQRPQDTTIPNPSTAPESPGTSSQLARQLRQPQPETESEAPSLSENQRGKQRAVDKAPGKPADARKADHQKLFQQQQQRKKQQQTERERILAQVKHDREELKYRQDIQKAATQGFEEEQVPAKTEPTAPASPSKDGTYRIQVRLFDGTSIRSSFTAIQTINTDVRAWLDTQRSDGSTPYTLKAILHPQPNRTLSISEEEETLQNLGLGRTANLVMVPVRGYTEAYAGSAPGLASKGLSAGYDLVSGAAGAVYGAFGTFLGMGQVTPNSGAQNQPAQEQREEARPGQTGSNINIRTLRDQRNEKKDDHQLYNGNQVRGELLKIWEMQC